MRIATIPFILLIFLTVWVYPSAAEMVIIVNSSNSLSSLTAQDIRNIYLFKKITWENGEKIVPVNLSQKDSLRKEFSEFLMGRTPEEMGNLYLMRALSGLGQPPIVAGSSEEVKKHIKNNEGAIGYIDRKDLDPMVKEIEIKEKGKSRR